MEGRSSHRGDLSQAEQTYVYAVAYVARSLVPMRSLGLGLHHDDDEPSNHERKSQPCISPSSRQLQRNGTELSRNDTTASASTKTHGADHQAAAMSVGIESPKDIKETCLTSCTSKGMAGW